MKLNPYLHFEGHSEEVLNFYRDVFGGEILMINRYRDSPMQVDEDWKDKVMHARLKFGDCLIMVSDGPKGFKTTTNGNIQLSVEMDDENKMSEVFDKLAEGGKISMPLQDTFWGARFGMITDKFGFHWMFNHDIKKK